MNQPATRNLNSSAAASASSTLVVAIALGAALFGSFLVFGAGFAGSDVLHAAAHDSRHSFAFPCH